jgi:hypothetical protein
MARQKLDDEDKQKFKNIGLLKEDHVLLLEISRADQRSMARQLSVLIRKEVEQRSLQKETPPSSV